MKIVRHYQPYSSEHRAERSASFRMGHAARERMGEFFYVIEGINIAFPTRKAAREYAEHEGVCNA